MQKDLGTGKEQRITITASTKLSDEEIEKKSKKRQRDLQKKIEKKKETIEIKK